MPAVTASHTESAYNRYALFHQDGPFDPDFVTEAVRTLVRTLPLDAEEPQEWANQRLTSALRALAALHPRDEIEVMLSVQALAAYHTAAACWRAGMHLSRPHGDSTRHISAAASAARTFDTLLRAIERRQSKPLSVPVGRPAERATADHDATLEAAHWETRCQPCRTAETASNGGLDAAQDGCKNASPDDGWMDASRDPERDSKAAGTTVSWTPDLLAVANDMVEQARFEQENAGLDLAHTDGILPDGGMIVPENPTPQQAAYIGRRLGLAYRREAAEYQRNGIKGLPKIVPLRPGDKVP